MVVSETAATGSPSGKLVIETPGLPIRPGEAAPVRSTSLALATIDIVEAQATEQVQVFLVKEVTHGLCTRKVKMAGAAQSFTDLLPSTCAVFGQKHAMQLFRPTTAGLRAAVRQDIEGLMPKVVADATDPLLVKTGTPEQSRALFAIAFTSYLSSVVGGEDPLHAIGRLPERIQALSRTDSVKKAVAAAEITQILTHAGQFLDLYKDARARVRGSADVDAARDQVLVLALRTLMVNSADGEVWGGTYQNRRAEFERVLRTVPAMTEAIRNLESVVAATHTGATATSDRATLLTNALGAMADLFGSVLPDSLGTRNAESLRALATPARELGTALVRRDYRDALVQGLTVVANVNESNVGCHLANGLLCPNRGNLNSERLRLATFAAEFANAEDQKGMNEALRRFVNDGGGYSAKREGTARQYLTINAYLGGAHAWERPFRSDSTHFNTQNAFYLPVGVEFGRRLGNRYFPALGLFFQLVDLGSIAAARSTSDSDVDRPNPELLDVFSPGVFLVAPFFRTPLTVGFGGSVAPRAQIGRNSRGDREIAGAFRTSVFVAVDVPLFP
jgi:hypothetical protein